MTTHAETGRWTEAEVSEAILYGLEQGRGWEWAPMLSENNVSQVNEDGSLILALANGQTFKVTCEAVPR